jgi:hypothetical protein
MALSMIGAGLQQINQSLTEQVKQQLGQTGQQWEAEPRDIFQPGAPTEPLPWKGPWGPAATQPVTNQTPEGPKSMEQLDSDAADSINQLVQLSESRPVTPRPVAGSIVTNFHVQAVDHQMMIYDIKAAQAIQRQTQLAQKDKSQPNNPKTQAALARLGKRPIGAFTRQAVQQQSTLCNTRPAENKPRPGASTRPSQ